MNRNLSFEERLHNAKGAQEIENLKAIHAYTHAISYSREEWDRIWYKSDNSTWGHGFGRMVGWDQVYLDSVVYTDPNQVKRFGDTCVEFPVLRGHDLRSTGSCGAHALSVGIIEIADDGQSGRSFYVTPGTMFGNYNAMGRREPARNGGWFWERYGSDFVYRDGRWLYIHEQVAPDFDSQYDDKNWAHDVYVQELNNAPERPATMPLGGVAETDMTHQMFKTTQLFQKTCPPPEPYRTLDDENSYSPGHNDIGPLDVEAYNKNGGAVSQYESGN